MAKLVLVALCIAFLAVAEGHVLRVKPFGLDGPASGTVYSTDGFLKCGFDGYDQCEIELGDSQSVTLVAVPRAGSIISKGSGNGANEIRTWAFTKQPAAAAKPFAPQAALGATGCTNGNSVCTFNVVADVDVVVRFSLGPTTDGSDDGSRGNGVKVTQIQGFIDSPVSDGNADEPHLPISSSNNPTFTYILNNARQMTAISFICSDGVERKNQSPLSTVPSKSFTATPAPALPTNGFCVVRATFDNKDRGSQPSTYVHEYGFEVRRGVAAVDVLTESDISTEGIVDIADPRIFWRPINFILAAGEVFKGKLPANGVAPENFPYIADAEISIKGSTGTGTVVCNIGFVLPSSSVIHLSGDSNRAQIVLNPGDTRGYAAHREFDVYRGNNPPYVAIVCKNVGLVRSLNKRDTQDTQANERAISIGPLVYNFIPRDTTTTPVVENKFVHRFDFANTMRVKP
jgi:hypothetical protein